MDKAKRLNEVERCWLKRGDKYILHNTKKHLPIIYAKYKEALDRLKIPYFVYDTERQKDVTEYCVYWNPEWYEEVEAELPVYEFDYEDNLYQCVGKRIGNVPTKKSIEKAYEIKDKVVAEVSRLKNERNVEAICRVMDGKNAIYTSLEELRVRPDEGNLNGKFQIFYIKKSNGTKCNDMVIFDLEKIKNEEVELSIPENKIERILGKDSEIAATWVDILGVDHIKVLV